MARSQPLDTGSQRYDVLICHCEARSDEAISHFTDLKIKIASSQRALLATTPKSRPLACGGRSILKRIPFCELVCKLA